MPVRCNLFEWSRKVIFCKMLGGVKVIEEHTQRREFRDWLMNQSVAVAGWLVYRNLPAETNCHCSVKRR